MTAVASAGTEGAAVRARERHRRLARSTLAGAGSRALALVALFVAVPLVGGQLGPERLGVWVLLVSAVALLGFADLGMGNGLLNVVAEAHGADDAKLAQEAISSAFFALTAIAAGLGGVFALVYPHVDWAALLNVRGAAAADVGPAIAVFTTCVLVSAPLGVGQRIHLARQEGWIASAWTGLGSVLSIVGVITVHHRHGGTAAYLAVMLGGLPLAYLVESVLLLRRPANRPRLALVTSRTTRRVVHTGVLFFVLAVSGAVAYETDALIVAHVLGARAVPTYAIPLRLFLLAPTAVALLVTPLWPAYREALVRGDHAWVQTTLRRSIVGAVVITVPPSVALIAGAGPVLHRWSSTSATPPLSLLVGMALWAAISAVSTALAMFFNGANAVRFQIVIAGVMASTNLALSLVLVHRIGIAGPIWGSVVTQALIVLGPELVIVSWLRRPVDGWRRRALRAVLPAAVLMAPDPAVRPPRLAVSEDGAHVALG